jgi:hypothetical protein
LTRKFALFIALFLSFHIAFTQTIVKGSVFSADTHKPLPSVSVYLNNTSIGTTTDEKGLFILSGIPSGKLRLIASCIGYGSCDTLLDAREIPRDFIISLNPRSKELQGVAVYLSYDPNGWEKWGKVFTDIFIGTTPNAYECHLENPKALKFRLNSHNILKVFANEPLQVINSVLGYEIIYNLEGFEFNFNNNLVSYMGYAFFKDLAISNPKRAIKYQDERQKIYKGSLMHFMRSFFADNLQNEGFEMRSLEYISNPEKDRAKKMLSHYNDSPNGYDPDSADYFKKVLRQPDSVISHQVIAPDSIRFAVDNTTVGLFFRDSVEVLYKRKGISYKYKSLYNVHKNEIHPVSQFVFVNKRPVYVLSSGYYYYNPYDLKMTGYWAWWENMSTRLPYDYSFVKKL